MKENKKSTASVRTLTTAAIIAALYVILTGLSAMLGIASGVIQVRLSEALTILPYFTPAAVPGVTVGCLLANLLTGAPLPDIIFGTLATFLGAVGARLLRKYKYLTPVPTILSNALIIPLVLQYAYGVPDAFWFLFLTVGAGEVISAGILGILLLHVAQKRRLFHTD
ncbi:MAG: QueT transporter family protein [Lachnospiraceae bacterium]|nr:QueT transporter family protein [Lachnospiraceae bacterium]